MNFTLPLNEMTLADKLRVLEIVWDDVRRHESELESPAWHTDALKETAARVESGRETPVDWDLAKKELRRRFE